MVEYHAWAYQLSPRPVEQLHVVAVKKVGFYFSKVSLQQSGILIFLLQIAMDFGLIISHFIAY